MLSLTRAVALGIATKAIIVGIIYYGLGGPENVIAICLLLDFAISAGMTARNRRRLCHTISYMWRHHYLSAESVIAASQAFPPFVWDAVAYWLGIPTSYYYPHILQVAARWTDK